MQTHAMKPQTAPTQPAASPRKGAVDGVRNELSVFLKVKPVTRNRSERCFRICPAKLPVLLARQS